MKTRIPKMKHKFYDTVDFITFLIGIIGAVLILCYKKQVKKVGKNEL